MIKEKVKKVTEEILAVYGPQICFTADDGSMLCNYTFSKYGKPVVNKSGKWRRFWPKFRRKLNLKQIAEVADLPFKKEIFVDSKNAIK